jgi:transposase
MKKRYVVRLSAEERDRLEGLVNRGREAAYRRRHAQVLLLVDEGEHGAGMIDREVAERVACTRRTVEQIRERCVREGLQAALERRARSRERSRVLDGQGEARLVSLACSEPPPGRSRWTLRMLGDRLVELEAVESISTETVRQVLKKHSQTLAEAHVVHSRRSERGVCVPDGSGVGGVSSSPWSVSSGGVHGRDHCAMRQGGVRPHTGTTAPQRALRCAIRTQRGGAPAGILRPFRQLAPRGRRGQSCGTAVGARHPAVDTRGLP